MAVQSDFKGLNIIYDLVQCFFLVTLYNALDHMVFIVFQLQLQVKFGLFKDIVNYSLQSFRQDIAFRKIDSVFMPLFLYN